MDKLYAVKLKKTQVLLKGRMRDVQGLMGHNTTKTLDEVVTLIKEKGIGCVETIRHDDKTPRNTRQLNRNEILEMWKAVERNK